MGFRERKTTMRKYLNVEEVADILRIGAASIRKAIKSGQLRAIKIGNEYRVSQEALDEYIQSIEVPAKVG
jgi:excisionase family DNA binding protein